tara:strand:+ start:8802 stop:9107 length:306 start_codon:yes stop_codon:yes gene_type:complete
MFSKELENALEAMRKITDTADMNVLASEYNKHITFLGKMKAKKFQVVIGDTIEWTYGGIKKFGKVYKVNPRTVLVYQQTGASIGSTQVKLDKSLITGKVAA